MSRERAPRERKSLVRAARGAFAALAVLSVMLILFAVALAQGGGSGGGDSVAAPAGAAGVTGELENEATRGVDWLKDVLPNYFFSVEILNVGLWQWIGLILLVFLASAAAFLATSIVVRALRGVVARTRTEWDDELLDAATGPLRLASTVLGFYLGALMLGLSSEAGQAVEVICKILALVAVTWLILRLTDIFGTITESSLRKRGRGEAVTIVPMGRRITKVFIIVIAALSLLQNLGFNIAGLLAGLGVGGLAVALAAQKTLENLFGGIVIAADRPAAVGDFCRVGEHIGTVEDIGLRSTRVRTLDRTLVTIANAEFSTVRIENYARRDRIRLYATIGVGYDTTPDQMRYLLVEMRRMLYAHPMVNPDPCRVRFVNFGAFSLDLEIFAYVDTTDWNTFLGVREDIYLRIMDIVEASGTYFAYPSQTLYLGRDAGRDPDRSKEAEAKVAEWRKKAALFIPEFSNDEIKKIDDSLEYPAPGSPGHREGGSAGADV